MFGLRFTKIEKFARLKDIKEYLDMNFSKIFSTIVVLALLVGGYFYFSPRQVQAPNTENPQNEQNQTITETPTPSPSPKNTVPEKAVATIETSLGLFEVTLDGKSAPKTVANFIKLANEGFYNGLNFHRIVQSFMIQGGDPKGDGTGGPGYTIPAEIKLKHTAGAIAMARLSDQVNPNKDSSGSQFYVTLAAQTFLDGEYTVFGYVTKGMDIADTFMTVAPVEVSF